MFFFGFWGTGVVLFPFFWCWCVRVSFFFCFAGAGRGMVLLFFFPFQGGRSCDGFGGVLLRLLEGLNPDVLFWSKTIRYPDYASKMDPK